MISKKIMYALLCGFLVVGCSNSQSTTDDSSEDKTEEKEDTTKKNDELLKQYATGTYCVSIDGMAERAKASTNSDVVCDTFQKGVAVEAVEIVIGDDDSNSVWARIESPNAGYMCIKDDNGTYMMTKDEYANSGIKTDASPVTDTQSTEETQSSTQTKSLPDPRDYINHTYSVQVGSLNVRKAASTSADVVSSMSYGETVYVQGVEINENDGSVWALVMEGYACIQDGDGNQFMYIKD